MEALYELKKTIANNGSVLLELYYTESTEWMPHVRNTLAFSIIDTGDNIVIGNTTFDYGQIEEMKILLNNL
jgi:hypothetical protein